MGFCPSWQKSVWAFVLVGKNQDGLLSKLAKFQVWAFVRWAFVRLPIKLISGQQSSYCLCKGAIKVFGLVMLPQYGVL